MPASPRQPCAKPGCPRLRPCPIHRTPDRQYDERRGSAASRGYGRDWRKAREDYLAENPFCDHCDELGRTKLAKIVDHIVPHRGDPKLFWDRGNWQGLCGPCHSSWKQREELRG